MPYQPELRILLILETVNNLDTQTLSPLFGLTIWTFALSHTALPVDVQKMSGQQCLCERGFTQGQKGQHSCHVK